MDNSDPKVDKQEAKKPDVDPNKIKEDEDNDIEDENDTKDQGTTNNAGEGANKKVFVAIDRFIIDRKRRRRRRRRERILIDKLLVLLMTN